uniref:SAM domain-containing protein n=1 Tax=Acrobeloides nanus TaxID=290746 RepID=A0A914CUF7_9BILA
MCKVGSRYGFLFLFIIGNLINFNTGDKPSKPTKNVVITAEQEKLRDPEGFAAIKELHRLMDDDQSGSIDRFESADFLTEDLKIGGSDRSQREKAFHHDDDAITVDDLWEMWFEKSEREWDEKQLVEWLTNVVKLPQYVNNFVTSKVTGIALPRMALQNSSYISNVIGIKNFVHRQKIQLKALDLVLFGFHDSNSRLKDYALALLLVILVSVLIIFKMHRNKAHRRMEELSSMLSELKSMENDFAGAEKRFEERRASGELENIQELKNQLKEAEKRLEMSDYESVTISLQPLLRRTYELELSYLRQQNLKCLEELEDAKDFLDKMRKKQGSLMNSLKLATGANAGTDSIDARIFDLKSRMGKIKLSMDECHQRWIEIETLCGFSISGSFGPAQRLPEPPTRMHVTAKANPISQPARSSPIGLTRGDSGFVTFNQQTSSESSNGITTAAASPIPSTISEPVLMSSPAPPIVNNLRHNNDDDSSVSSRTSSTHSARRNKFAIFSRKTKS